MSAADPKFGLADVRDALKQAVKMVDFGAVKENESKEAFARYAIVHLCKDTLSQLVQEHLRGQAQELSAEWDGAFDEQRWP